MTRQLSGMVVVITGASAGIGRALAVELGRSGAKLALGARRVDRLDELSGSLGGGHLCLATDVSRPEDCQRLVAQTIERFGRIDTLVCNAGYGFLCAVAETTPQRTLDMFRTNVLGTTECIRAAAPHMAQQDLRDGWRGQVMIVSSSLARRGLPYFGAYSATKAAQLSLAEALRVELAPQRIAVTSVHPGSTSTEFGDVSAAQSGGSRPKRISLEVTQSAEEVARMMVRAIQRPRPELWPIGSYRWLTSLGTLFPGVVDGVMGRRADQIAGR